MARPDKAAAVAELAEQFRGSSAVLLTEYRGLSVAQLKQLRRSLAGNASYAVVKNTLTKIAANKAGISVFDDDFGLHAQQVAFLMKFRDLVERVRDVSGVYMTGRLQ